MSFLADDEAMATLEEVVAFIDTCNGDHSSADEVATSESESGGSPFVNVDANSDAFDVTLDTASFLSNQEPEAHISSLPLQERKKKRKASGSSTQLQRRKKAEILALREQVQQLEADLQHLKCIAGVSTSGNSALGALTVDGSRIHGAQARWFSEAVTQYQERLRSEMTNRKLRAILANQAAVNEAFRGLSQKQHLLSGMDFVFESPTPTARHSLSDIDNSRSVLAQLEKMVDGLYLDSSSVFQSRAHSSISSNLMGKRDLRRGKSIEITTTTPIACSTQDAADQMWRDFTTQRDSIDKTIRYMRERKPSGFEKNFSLTMRGSESVTPANGLAFMRKYEEPNRIVLVMAQHLLLPTEVLQFGIHCWTVVTGSEEEPRHSVVSTVLQLVTYCKEGAMPRQADLHDAEEMVLGTLSVTMRRCVHDVLSSLVEETEQVDCVEC